MRRRILCPDTVGLSSAPAWDQNPAMRSHLREFKSRPRWSVPAMLLGGALAGAIPGVVADDAPVFPFVLPWDDAAPGVTDLSSWRHKPAGKFGPIRVGDDGHFHAGPERIRFFGVNLSFAGGMPAKADGEKVAARLAKFGVNVVRFHHMDTGAWPDGIRNRDARSTGEPHPEALDRLSCFIAQLKQRGIYANLNLLVGRPFNAADGLPAEIEKLDWKDRHLIGFFDAKQLALQKEYARRLLTHRNPYTGLAFTEDPAVAFVEINNEQGLLHSWLGGNVDGLPEVFLQDLQRQWNGWLKARHGSTVKLRAAWSAGEQALGRELLLNSDFAGPLSQWNLERHAGAEASATVEAVGRDATSAPASASNPDGGPRTVRPAKAVRISIAKPGAESWHVQFNQAGLKLETDKAYTLRFWAKADAPRSLSVAASQAHENWSNLGLSANAPVTGEWREFKFICNAGQSDDNARITFSNFGGAGAGVWLAGLSLRPGGVEGLKTGEELERGTGARFEKRTFGERTAEAQRDWMRFLQDTEERYWLAMLRFIKDELKVKALVTGTIVGCSTPNLMAKMDWVDTHSYWQHPNFPRRPWDAEDWTVNNQTMVNERGGTLPGLALKRIAGKPHACTEYNHPAPNTYASEGLLLVAAYAALQDWDALYVYGYAHSRTGGWDGRKINGFFDIDQHPTKMATLPAAAALFVRGDVRAAKQIVVAELGREQEADLLRNARSWSLVDAGNVGVPREAVLVHRVGLATGGRAAPVGSLKPGDFKPAGNRFVADTGELTWDLSEAGRGVVTANTPHSKAVIGFGGGRRFVLGEFLIEPGDGLQNGWSAITLTAIDTGAKSPKHWLITATGYAENTGMKWKNPEKSSVGRDWGSAPSRVEGVPARITLPAAASRVQAWSLDERGQRKQKLSAESAADGKSVLSIGPQWQTLWYEAILE